MPLARFSLPLSLGLFLSPLPHDEGEREEETPRVAAGRPMDSPRHPQPGTTLAPPRPEAQIPQSVFLVVAQGLGLPTSRPWHLAAAQIDPLSHLRARSHPRCAHPGARAEHVLCAPAARAEAHGVRLCHGRRDCAFDAEREEKVPTLYLRAA